MMVKLSVVVPIYNTAEYLEKCINSIREQSYQEMEMILVDDGSTDGSGEICDKYCDIDPRIRVIHQENSGVVSARWSGINTAQGEYIGFVDSDDWIAPDMYEVLMEEALEKQCEIVAMGHIAVQDGKEVKVEGATAFGVFEKGKDLDKLRSNMIYDIQCRNQGINSVLWSKVFKRGLLINSLRDLDRNITIGEDAAVMYPCCLCAERISILRSYQYFYRVREDSMCHSRDVDSFRRSQYFYEYMKGIFANQDEKYRLLEQLKRYIWSYQLSDTIKCVYGIRVAAPYGFPYDAVEKNCNIILYGAGKVGQFYYDQIQDNHYCNIVAWVDKKISNERVQRIGEFRIQDFEFTCVLIAVNRQELADEIKSELKALGIDESKMIWRKPRKDLEITDCDSKKI